MRIEIIHEIASSLRNNKLRTALTGFAVSWGIFLLIALLGAGNGLMNSFMGNMAAFISQSINVSGWRTSKPYTGYTDGRYIQLDQRDLAYTESDRWQGVIENISTSTSSSSANLTLNGKSVNGWLLGVEPDY
ncbi:MAG: ABC transporter permease, partial [Bacteroidales bacterium]|nr:ABC transporter permease [Bacteroidales bacterium]